MKMRKPEEYHMPSQANTTNSSSSQSSTCKKYEINNNVLVIADAYIKFNTLDY